jgi:hypothetical protein
MYKVTIADVAELTEEVQLVEFDSAIPKNADARSSNIGATLIITGQVNYDFDKTFMKEATQKIASWSLYKPDSAETYKTVTVVFNHTGTTRTYELSHAFVVSFKEGFGDQIGNFELVVRQRKDRLDGVKSI